MTTKLPAVVNAAPSTPVEAAHIRHRRFPTRSPTNSPHSTADARDNNSDRSSTLLCELPPPLALPPSQKQRVHHCPPHPAVLKNNNSAITTLTTNMSISHPHVAEMHGLSCSDSPITVPSSFCLIHDDDDDDDGMATPLSGGGGRHFTHAPQLLWPRGEHTSHHNTPVIATGDENVAPPLSVGRTPLRTPTFIRVPSSTQYPSPSTTTCRVPSHVSDEVCTTPLGDLHEGMPTQAEVILEEEEEEHLRCRSGRRARVVGFHLQDDQGHGDDDGDDSDDDDNDDDEEERARADAAQRARTMNVVHPVMHLIQHLRIEVPNSSDGWSSAHNDDDCITPLG